MKTRVGPLRALLATIATLALVLPVGVMEHGAPRAISIPQAISDLAHGRLGVGVLFAFGEGLEAAALVRLGIVVAAWVAFVLVRLVWSGRAEAAQGGPRTTCASCGFRTARAMVECPACGASMRSV